MLTTAALALAYCYVVWLLYVLVMGFYRAHLAGRLHPGTVRFWLAAPVVVVGYLADIVLQWTVGTVLFADLPRPGENLLTARLKRYMRGRDHWRRRWAEWICTHLLDPFDPKGDHC
ncbi:MAG: hypothetical protein N2688_00495 [Burkholderiaceae bacterium]|nr:hypothetical protein [Burkholderiaceae bacterium]